MAMLIGKFHKIIQSRLVWGVFAVLIILSFVVWGSAPYWADSGDPAGGRAAGVLSGREVTEADIREAQSHVIYAALLQASDHPLVQPVIDRISRRRLDLLGPLLRAPETPAERARSADQTVRHCRRRQHHWYGLNVSHQNKLQFVCKKS